MIDTWFTSDTHFGHKNILQYEPEARPFKSIYEMHEVMIDNWNSVVKCKDVVYHLGDFCFGKQWLAIAARLNGRKKLVMGNHDTYNSSEYLKYFDKLYGVVFWERCVLSHMPVHPNGLGSRWLLNVHGHLHSKRVLGEHQEINYLGQVVQSEDRNYFNVSCEQNNLKPFHRDDIMLRLKEID